MPNPDRVIARFEQQSAQKPVYVGVFLDPSEHQKLLAWWEKETGLPLLGLLTDGHMTIKFKPTPEDLAKIPLNERVQMKVIGWAADEKGQAVLVDSNTPSFNAHPHITISTEPPTRAVYSNELLARGHTRVSGPTLTGVVDTFPRGR